MIPSIEVKTYLANYILYIITHNRCDNNLFTDMFTENNSSSQLYKLDIKVIFLDMMTNHDQFLENMRDMMP